jgi:hypothetical protein
MLRHLCRGRIACRLKADYILAIYETLIKLCLKDKHVAELNRQAQAVNRIWNYANEVQRHYSGWTEKYQPGLRHESHVGLRHPS